MSRPNWLHKDQARMSRHGFVKPGETYLIYYLTEPTRLPSIDPGLELRFTDSLDSEIRDENKYILKLSVVWSMLTSQTKSPW